MIRRFEFREFESESALDETLEMLRNFSTSRRSKFCLQVLPLQKIRMELAAKGSRGPRNRSCKAQLALGHWGTASDAPGGTEEES